MKAQTLANVYLAIDHDLDVMPVINKIDLPSADPERVVNEIEDVIGIEAQDAPRISAKNGINIEEVLEQIVTKIPAPHGDPGLRSKHSYLTVCMTLTRELSYSVDCLTAA